MTHFDMLRNSVVTTISLDNKTPIMQTFVLVNRTTRFTDVDFQNRRYSRKYCNYITLNNGVCVFKLAYKD